MADEERLRVGLQGLDDMGFMVLGLLGVLRWEWTLPLPVSNLSAVVALGPLLDLGNRDSIVARTNRTKTLAQSFAETLGS